MQSWLPLYRVGNVLTSGNYAMCRFVTESTQLARRRRPKPFTPSKRHMILQL